MALPKALNRIEQRLERIEAKLDALGGGGVTIQSPSSFAEPAPDERGYLWTSTPRREMPDEVAARLAYDTYSAREILERVESLTGDERAALAEYEAAHKNRVTVLEALGNPQSGASG